MGKTKETANLVSNGFLTPGGAGGSLSHSGGTGGKGIVIIRYSV